MLHFMKAGLIDLDATYFVQLALFLLVYMVLRVAFFGPYTRLLRRREEATEGLRRRASEALEKARQIEEQIEAKLRAAHSEALVVRRRLVEDGARLKHEVVLRERERMQKELQRYLEALEEEKNRCLAEVKSAAAALAALVENQVRAVEG